MNCLRSEQQIQNISEAQEVSPTTHLCTAHHSAVVVIEMSQKQTNQLQALLKTQPVSVTKEK